MAIIQWTDDMSLGVETLDEQHKDLMHLLNQAYETVLRNPEADDEQRIQAMLQDMRDYARDHFDLEEEHMLRLGYPGTQNHAFLHKEFLQRINELERAQGRRELHLDIFLFLADWLRTHILREDMDFADYAYSARERDSHINK
ncbi:bacteriohemerythrin [Paucidesulfovibrio gracilis]|uniref:bacteriohemerythrin n=1 Tax=Paucidesulfovibrio gracilis TaxID=47158 RepID=UPI0013564CC4|nr:bacteriohemerythrin [Paucidesulfovibrio gracilis]